MISNKNLIVHSILVAATIGGAMSMPQMGTAKGVTWTIEMRQAKLMQEINIAQKHKELTDKEAKKLRSDLSDIARKKKKFKTESTKAGGKNAGNLTTENNQALEDDLNEISTNIKKLQLEKRTSK